MGIEDWLGASIQGLENYIKRKTNQSSNTDSTKTKNNCMNISSDKLDIDTKGRETESHLIGA